MIYCIRKLAHSSPIQKTHKNDFLFSVQAPVSALNIALNKCNIVRRLTANLINNNNYYILYYLPPQLQQQSTGSTFDAINKTKLENLVIKNHNLSEQIKIRRLLDSLIQQIQIKLETSNIKQL